jgi:hypothetical protein
LNLLDNEIVDEGEGHSVQQNISTPYNPEYSMGIPTESLKIVLRTKISMV